MSDLHHYMATSSPAFAQKKPTLDTVINVYKTRGWQYATSSSLAAETGYNHAVMENYLTDNAHVFSKSVIPTPPGENLYYVRTTPILSEAKDWWNAFGYLNSYKLGNGE